MERKLEKTMNFFDRTSKILFYITAVGAAYIIITALIKIGG